MSRLSVRHCSRLLKSRFKNYQATERKIQILWSSTDRKKGSNNWNSYSANFKSGPKPTKMFRVELNTTRHKRKTLTMFWRLLEDLWVSLVRSKKFCNLLTLQVSKEIRSTIKCLWNLVVATRSTTSDLNLWVRSQSHKCGSSCSTNPREKSPWS